MAGPNTSGLPDVKDYTVGRGKLMAAILNATTYVPGPWRDLGNCPELKVQVTEQTLKHMNSISGLKFTDKEVVISQELLVSLKLDEINSENLAMLFNGTQATVTNPSITAVTSPVTIAADGTLVAGRWYELKNAAGARLFDITAANVTVTTTEVSPVTLALNTDYLLDLEFGLIFFLTTSTLVATAIAATKSAKFATTAMASARNINRVIGLNQLSSRVCLKFLAVNPADENERTEYQFHQIALKANGDYNLISDNWADMGFQGVAEKNTAIESDSPTLTIRNLLP